MLVLLKLRVVRKGRFSTTSLIKLQLLSSRSGFSERSSLTILRLVKRIEAQLDLTICSSDFSLSFVRLRLSSRTSFKARYLQRASKLRLGSSVKSTRIRPLFAEESWLSSIALGEMKMSQKKLSFSSWIIDSRRAWPSSVYKSFSLWSYKIVLISMFCLSSLVIL